MIISSKKKNRNPWENCQKYAHKLTCNACICTNWWTCHSDLEGLEKLDASDIYPRRINAKEILIREKDDEFPFSFADGTTKLSGGAVISCRS